MRSSITTLVQTIDCSLINTMLSPEPMLTKIFVAIYRPLWVKWSGHLVTYIFLHYHNDVFDAVIMYLMFYTGDVLHKEQCSTTDYTLHKDHPSQASSFLNIHISFLDWKIYYLGAMSNNIFCSYFRLWSNKQARKQASKKASKQEP